MYKCMAASTDWRSVAFDWNRARAFLVTAEEGSFSAAARALGQAQPTLGRQVAALEEELGVTLFERVGNNLVLTETGLDLVEQLRTMHEAAARVALIAAGQSQSLEGRVRIAASPAVSAHLLPPVLAQLREAHPGIDIELVISNESADLRRREADVAVRHYRPEGDELIGRLDMEASEAHIYGSREYLASIGNPRTMKTLAARGRVFAFDDTPLMLDTLHAAGYPFTAEQLGPIVSDHLVQWELTRKGQGLCLMMSEVGDRDPLVRRALAKGKPVVTLPTWLTTHRELRTNRRMRVVFDALAEHLSSL